MRPIPHLIIGPSNLFCEALPWIGSKEQNEISYFGIYKTRRKI